MPPYFQEDFDDVRIAKFFNCLNRSLADPQYAIDTLLHYMAGYNGRNNTHNFPIFDTTLTSMQRVFIHKFSKRCLKKFTIRKRRIPVSTVFALEIEESIIA